MATIRTVLLYSSILRFKRDVTRSDCSAVGFSCILSLFLKWVIQIWCSSSYSCSLALSFIACITFFNSVFFSFYGTVPSLAFYFFRVPCFFLSSSPYFSEWLQAILFCSLLFIYFLSCCRLFHIQSFHPPSASLTTTINSIVRIWLPHLFLY